MAQGDLKTGTKGTNSLFVLDHNKIKWIPADRTFTYANIVVHYLRQKKDPNRVRITAGGDLINYPGELTTRTEDLRTSKMPWNRIISTINAKHMCIDIKTFYLCTLFYRLEYIRIPLSAFPEHITKHYNLREKVLNEYVYV